MKKIIFLIIIVFAVLSFAEEKFSFAPTITLQQISAQTNIPVKQITQYLKLNDQTDFNMTIQKLGISNEDINNALTEYNANKNSFYTGIIFVGMGIVFASLLLVGFIINLLQHIGDPKKKKSSAVRTSVSKVTISEGKISDNGIIVAITAMFLHDAEEKDKINLTWKRKTISIWQAAGMVENRTFEDRRGNK